MLASARYDNRIGRHRDLSWNVQYTIRKAQAIHDEEDTLLPVRVRDMQRLLHAAIATDHDILDPPEYSFQALREFLADADYSALTRPQHQRRPRPKLAIFDDRNDENAVDGPTRDWDSALYRDVPPRGSNEDFGAVDEYDLHAQLKKKVPQFIKPGRD